MQDHFKVSSSASALYLGGITLISGIGGTLSGSFWFTFSMKQMNALHSEKKISDEQLQICYVEKCTKLSFILMAIASIILGTVIIVDKLYIYLAGLLVGEFLIFFCLSPYPIGFFKVLGC